MKTIMKEMYVTPDGKEFLDIDLAVKHEEFINSLHKEVYIVVNTYNPDTDLTLKRGIITDLDNEDHIVVIKCDDNTWCNKEFKDIHYSLESAKQELNSKCDYYIHSYTETKNHHLKDLKYYLQNIKKYKLKKLQDLK